MADRKIFAFELNTLVSPRDKTKARPGVSRLVRGNVEQGHQVLIFSRQGSDHLRRDLDTAQVDCSGAIITDVSVSLPLDRIGTKGNYWKSVLDAVGCTEEEARRNMLITGEDRFSFADRSIPYVHDPFGYKLPADVHSSVVEKLTNDGQDFASGFAALKDQTVLLDEGSDLRLREVSLHHPFNGPFKLPLIYIARYHSVGRDPANDNILRFWR